jgi:uncharacterized glyoxalase superfamily protein PhnB
MKTTGFLRAVPVLRSFDETKAKEFYLDYLGFEMDWEHRFEAGMPLYMSVSRDGLTLHISEHHGDATPGGAVFVETEGLHALHQELREKSYGMLRPDIEDAPWNAWCMEVVDPFGNKLRFSETKPDAERMRASAG